MNHPYIANSNAKLAYQQKLDEAANSRRLKALKTGQPKRSFFARLFGRARVKEEAQATPNLKTQTEGRSW